MADDEHIKAFPQQTAEAFHDMPTSADLPTLVQLTKERGSQAFKGRQLSVAGEIEPSQLDELTDCLDHEVALVMLADGERVLALGERREFAPHEREFQSRGRVVAHLHTHVPLESGKPETLRRGPSTSDMRVSQDSTIPLLLRVSGKTYEYKDSSAGTMQELRREFFGDPQATIRAAIDDETSEVHTYFWDIIHDMGVHGDDTEQIEQLKARYARQEAGAMILSQAENATAAELTSFTAFIVGRMSDPTWQANHPGAYIHEHSDEQIRSMFNPTAGKGELPQ